MDAGTKGSGIIVRVSCLPYFPRKFARAWLTPKILWPLFDSYVKGTIFRNWLPMLCPRLVTGNLDKVELAVWKVANMCQVDHLLPEVGPATSQTMEILPGFPVFRLLVDMLL